MDKEDRSDFFRAKCDYYQKYVELSLVICTAVSLLFLLPEAIINGSVMPTLVPRLSAPVFLLVYLIGISVTTKRNVIILLDFIMAHALVLVTVWTLYNLENRSYITEGIMVMNVIFLIAAFAARPSELVVSSVIYILEIIISHRLIGYADLHILLILEVVCTLGVVYSHQVLTLYFLDHYRVQQRLELAMITDPLTQVYNRHLLEKIVKRNALKDVDGPTSFAMLDIDNFKTINDTNGHYTGDLTLLYVGQKLARETHDNDYVIRYGGEEFVIIFKNCDVNNACARMEQFRRDIEQAKDTPVPFTVSVGVSRYTGDYSKSIQNVDAALYKAKNTGRNKVVVI